MVITGDQSDVFSTPYVHLMSLLAVHQISWVNENIGSNNEKSEAVNNNIIFVLANNEIQTWEGAV